MISFVRNQSRKASFFFILLAILLVLNGFAREDQEEGGCKKALKKCIDDAEKMMPNFHLFINYLGYCMVGYVFCVKYLAN